MGAEFKAEGRRVARRVTLKGEGMARKDEGQLGIFLQQSIQKRFKTTNNFEEDRS